MGLSGRRRAKAENRRDTAATNPSTEEVHTHRLQASASKRQGHTYRRVFHDEARERKCTNLLAFRINRGWSNDLLPARQATHPEILASPNANLYDRNMIRLMDTDYTSRVTYSLNKKHRWDFTKQLLEEYDTKEELKAQNVFFTEAVARGRREPTVRRLVTNATYTVAAADELRKHKQALNEEVLRQTRNQKETDIKIRSQLKHHVLENDRFQFSDRVKTSQTERPLATVASATRGGSVSSASVTRSCNLWNHLYNVSPSAEESRLSLQRDYDGRMVVSVGTCVPSPHVDVNRCTQSEKDTRLTRLNDRYWPSSRQRERIIRKQSRFEMEMQLDMDGCWSPMEAPEGGEIEEFDCRTSGPTEVLSLIDYMRPKISANRNKKLAEKARKIRLQKSENSRKLRGNTYQTSDGSSGYDSGSDGSEEKGEAMFKAAEEKEQIDARLFDSVEVALSMNRPTVQVRRADADTHRISGLFLEASLGSALMVSASTPRKMAVLLHPDLSENVVFEEIEDEAYSEFTRFAVHHVYRNDGAAPRTAAIEVTTQTDPFDFLRRLAADASLNGPAAIGKKSSVATIAIAGWKQATAMTESQARLTAIRALPMFDAAEDSCLDAELVPAPDCEICCQKLTAGAADSFADGATMLRECGHRFCNRCWLQHVASSIARGRADVSCPGFQCKTPLDAATLLWFCPSDLVSALTSAAFRSWLSERSERRQRRLCPQVNCGRVLECRAGVNAMCKCSGRGLCVGCGQEPHWPSDCATAAKYHSKMKALGHEKLAQRDLNAETDVNAKQCPTCFLIMEKGVGCNHMSCPCGEHFCWWCGQPMRTHSGGPCIGTTSGGRGRSEFRVQRVFTAQDSFLVPNSAQSRLYCAAVRVRINRGSSDASPSLKGASRNQLTSLFTSYAIRFQDVGRSSAYSLAQETSERLVRATAHASYLVEYSYAHVDNHRVERRTGTAVRALGSHIAQLVDAMTAEAKEQCRFGFRGPKQTRLACERLLMMLSCLESKCRLLYCVVANQRERGEMVPRGRKAVKV